MPKRLKGCGRTSATLVNHLNTPPTDVETHLGLRKRSALPTVPALPVLIDTILKNTGTTLRRKGGRRGGGRGAGVGGVGGLDRAAQAQWPSRQEAGRAGAGLGLLRFVQRLAGAAGPRPVRFLGMVSKGLLRLVSSVNRRRMKLLLGIALLAYAACECERRGREPIHSRAAGSGC